MPAPKQNPAVVAAAIATALRLAKAAKMAKTASSIAKKPVVKVQPELKIKPRLKFGKIMNAKSNVKVTNIKRNVADLNKNLLIPKKLTPSEYQSLRNKASDLAAKNAKSGKAARTAAEDIKERVGRAAKKPTIKITGK